MAISSNSVNFVLRVLGLLYVYFRDTRRLMKSWTRRQQYYCFEEGCWSESKNCWYFCLGSECFDFFYWNRSQICAYLDSVNPVWPGELILSPGLTQAGAVSERGCSNLSFLSTMTRGKGNILLPCTEHFRAKQCHVRIFPDCSSSRLLTIKTAKTHRLDSLGVCSAFCWNFITKAKAFLARNQSILA